MPDLREKIAQIRQLDRTQGEYVLARSDCKTTVEALRKIGASSAWYYQLDQSVRDELERLSDDLHFERIIQAEYTFSEAVPDAARVLVELLTDKRNKPLLREVANDILAYGGVQKAAQRIDARVQVADVAELLKQVYGETPADNAPASDQVIDVDWQDDDDSG